MAQSSGTAWAFVDTHGTFRLENPQNTNYLYFPLVNEAGMMSVVTPMLHGDAKTGQNTFLLPPVSVEDLHNTRSARNFWVTMEGKPPWSCTGNSALQLATKLDPDKDTATLEAGLLWHQVDLSSRELGLHARMTNFVPVDTPHAIELMRVTLTNTSDQSITFTPTAAIPIYGRSAENLRDHRHVTSLLHRTVTHDYGVVVTPTLSFDERGHLPNEITYAVLGVTGDGTAPDSFCPVLEDFIGEGGTLDWPEWIVRQETEGVPAGHEINGYESIGALRFAPITLAPGEQASYILVLGITSDESMLADWIARYGSTRLFDLALTACKTHWQEMASQLEFHSGDTSFDNWMRWVVVQPVLRRMFGNSFLPYHDYGRGGRGWRDLWQDCLALLLTEPDDVPDLLHSSFAGVRIDGSNATIIGSEPGEFIADRNNIPRVWMDHGSWPFLTVKLYIDQTGDVEFLLRPQSYFKDQHIKRCKAIDAQWQPDQGTWQRTHAGDMVQGSLLEHILIQHLTAFFHVGEHNIILLEGADWNDGMDMASQCGESVAFTALYANNLRELGELLLEMESRGITDLLLAEELILLLDSLNDAVDYNDINAKRQRLAAYFEQCTHTISGRQATIQTADIARDLLAKAAWSTEQIRQQEWITDAKGYSWFNGYYDDHGQRVEGEHDSGVRMTLTGQVFTLMGGVASDEQAQQIARAAERHLWEPAIGGYRLNTDFGGPQFTLGRGFGYAFGHKENGAMFSHMAVMYANALYKRGMIASGHQLLDTIYRHSCDFAVSRMYPGIPEYMSERGRGMYPYLTGSASWLLLTLVMEVYGVQGQLGHLVLAPRLVAAQFDREGTAGLTISFAGKRLKVRYLNPGKLDWDSYTIQSVSLNNTPLNDLETESTVVIPRERLDLLERGLTHRIDVYLTQKDD